MCVNYTTICGLSGSTIFFHIVPFSGRKKKVIQHKKFVLSFSTTFVSNIPYSKRNSSTCFKCMVVFPFLFGRLALAQRSARRCQRCRRTPPVWQSMTGDRQKIAVVIFRKYNKNSGERRFGTCRSSRNRNAQTHIFIETLSTDFSKKKKILECRISWASKTWEPIWSVLVDRRTNGQAYGMTKPDSRFPQFCERA